jgi:hypothetical protein
MFRKRWRIRSVKRLCFRPGRERSASSNFQLVTLNYLHRRIERSEKTSITGYSILQAASIEDAVALLKGHPHFHMPGSTVQVLECVPMPGM